MGIGGVEKGVGISGRLKQVVKRGERKREIGDRKRAKGKGE